MKMITVPRKERRNAALKAWSTIRLNRIREIKAKNESIEDYIFDRDSRKVEHGNYVISIPLIKPSRLTWVEKGGVGKELSDGWSLNFAIGCTHACRFCYVDSIHKRYGQKRAGNIVNRPWGNYFLIPSNIEQAIRETNWSKWEGLEAMMSSTHDPYLPQLLPITKKILEAALPAGVRLCIQTRSPLVLKDLPLLAKYRDQVRLQVSVATMDRKLASIIEPRVAPPESRLRVLEEASRNGIDTGVILAPIFPPVSLRPDVRHDMELLAEEVGKIAPNHIYGESLHIRGSNMSEIEISLGMRIEIGNFDSVAEKVFHSALRKHGLKGRWWKERK
jgi:DNA repair photolyase